MHITLGRRLAMLELVFRIPAKVLTHQKIADRLTQMDDSELGVLNPQVISRIFTGAAPDRLERSNCRAVIITNVVQLLEREVAHKDAQFWERHGTDPNKLIKALSAGTPDFLNYLANVEATAELPMESNRHIALSNERRLPVIPTLDKIQKEHAELLDAALGGRCFFYRLGRVPKTRTRRGGTSGIDFIPVLRRIPVWLENIGENYLTYKDKYTLYGEEADDDWADGYAFYTKQQFTIVAADFDTKGISELFLIQLKEDPIRRVPGNIHEGLIVMNGDLGKPSACKVLFRRAPEQFQSIPWEEFVETTELCLELFQAPDGTFRFKDRKQIDEVDGIPFSFYANKLLITDIQIDLGI